MDETIQRILRQERERRAVIDIKRGPVRVGNASMTFEPKALFGGEVTVWLPMNYTDVSEREDFALLYQWWKPLHIWDGRADGVTITWAKALDDADGESDACGESDASGEGDASGVNSAAKLGAAALMAKYMELLDSMQPDTIFYKDDIETVEETGREIYYTIFKTRGGDEYFFNICCFTELTGVSGGESAIDAHAENSGEAGVLVGTFECPYSDWPYWMKPVIQVMRSIEEDNNGNTKPS